VLGEPDAADLQRLIRGGGRRESERDRRVDAVMGVRVAAVTEQKV
jgi:hypothetical protein